jgi:hypothetical protein
VNYSGATASNPGGSNPEGEGPSQAIDNNVNTKWLDFNIQPLIIDFGQNTLVDSYTFATANDVNTRDPIGWDFSGSNNNSTWVELNSQYNYDTPLSRFTYLPYFSITDTGDQGIMGIQGTQGASGATGDREGATNGSPDVLTNDQAFRYLNGYGDLKNAFGTDIEAAKNHWIQFGYNAGRTIPGVAGAAGQAGATGPRGNTGPSGDIGNGGTYDLTTRTTSASSSTTTFATVMTSNSLPPGTYLITSHSVQTGASGGRGNYRFLNNSTNATFGQLRNIWVPWTGIRFPYYMFGISTLTTTGTFSYQHARFTTSGSITFLNGDLVCLRIA